MCYDSKTVSLLLIVNVTHCNILQNFNKDNKDLNNINKIKK